MAIENYGDFSERDENGRDPITEKQFREFQRIESEKIPLWAVKTYENKSNGILSYEDALEISKNYNKYLNQYGKQ